MQFWGMKERERSEEELHFSPIHFGSGTDWIQGLFRKTARFEPFPVVLRYARVHSLALFGLYTSLKYCNVYVHSISMAYAFEA